jgi:CheY-like chemotaxis protein
MIKAKPLILCVDDEENPLVLRKLVLEKAGYDVITARSAKEALGMLSSRPIDLVISDHLMPGTTGAELAQQIKAQRPLVPVVLISGLNEVPPGSSDADVFLSKLEGPDQLCSKVAALLRDDQAGP